MKILPLVSLLAACLAAVLPASAETSTSFFDLQEQQPPENVQNALDQYRDAGPDQAWTTLSKNSTALQDNTTARKQFSDYATRYGKVNRWTMLTALDLGQSQVRMSWYVIGFETGVVYMEVVSYQGPTGWIVTQVSMSDNYHDILPAFMLQM